MQNPNCIRSSSWGFVIIQMLLSFSLEEPTIIYRISIKKVDKYFGFLNCFFTFVQLLIKSTLNWLIYTEEVRDQAR